MKEKRKEARVGSDGKSVGEGGESDRRDGGRSAKAAKESKIKAMELITHYAPESNFSENYRSIRTAFLLSSAGPAGKR